MQPIRKIRLTAPNGGYRSFIRFENPINETGIESIITAVRDRI